MPVPAPTFSLVTDTTLRVDIGAASGGTPPYTYVVKRSPDSGGAPTGYANVSPPMDDNGEIPPFFNDAGLDPDTAYWYRVHAFDSLANEIVGTGASVTTEPEFIAGGDSSVYGGGVTVNPDGTVSDARELTHAHDE